MDYTQARMNEKYEQHKDRAIYHLNDFIYEASTDMEAFVDVVHKVFDFNFKPKDKHRFNELVYQRVPLTVEQCHPTSRAIATMLGESMPVEQFAPHVAEVLRNEYGGHNFVPFISKLIDEIHNDIT